MSVDKELAIQQVGTICKSEDFKHKIRMQDLLRYIVTEYLEGRENQLKGYSIGVDVFDQGDDFDPDHNALVRINVGRLRRLLKFYYLDKGLNDEVVIDIPKGKYIPDISFNKRENVRENPAHNSRAESFALSDTRVLVVPLKNINGGEELSFFIHGFSHELGTSLSKFDDIQVIRYSNFDGEQKTVDTLLNEAQEVDYVIEGDFTVFRNKAQLKLRLLDTLDKSQVWGDGFTLDLEADNLFELQDTLANKIAIGLGAEYGHISKHRMQEIQDTKNTSISEQKALLHYYYYLTSVSEEAINKMYLICKESLAAHPESAIVQALLANAYGLFYTLDYPGMDDAYEKFGELIEAAHKKKPTNHLIKAILAFKCFVYGEQSRFMALADDGLKNIPSSPLKSGTYGLYLSLYGEWEKGMEVFDQIRENNLDFPKWLYGASCLKFFKDGNYEEALVEANLYQIQNFFWGPLLRAATLGHLGRIEEAEKEIQVLLDWRPDFPSKGALLIGRYVKQESLADNVMEGLIKAGLVLDD